MNFLYQNQNSKCNSHDITDSDLNDIKKAYYIKNLSRQNVCDIINNYYKTNKNKNMKKCQNDTSILGDSISDINPLFFISFVQNDKIFCGDIREYVNLDKNPYTNTPFDNETKTLFSNTMINLKRLIKDTTEPIDQLVVDSLSVLMADIFSYLDYPNNINLFIEADELQIEDFINELIDYKVISTDEISYINDKDFYDYKMSLATLLKTKLQYNLIDPYHLTLVYNTIFNENNTELSALDIDLDNNFSIHEEELSDFYAESDMDYAVEHGDYHYVNTHKQDIRLFHLLTAISKRNHDLIDIITDVIKKVTEPDDIESIVKEIIDSGNYFYLPKLVDVSKFMSLQDVHIYIDNELYVTIPDHTKLFIESAGGILRGINTDF
jgi:hypothetical protein